MKLLIKTCDFLVRKCAIAAKWANVPLDCVISSEELLKSLSPFGIQPLLLTDDGIVANSNSILRYLGSIAPQHSLYGDSHLESAEVDQYLDFCGCKLEVWTKVLTTSLEEVSKEQRVEGKKQAQRELHRMLEMINADLRLKTFLVGHRVTLADISMCCAIKFVFEEGLLSSPAEQERLPHLTRWFKTVAFQGQFQDGWNVEPIECPDLDVSCCVSTVFMPVVPEPKKMQSGAVEAKTAKPQKKQKQQKKKQQQKKKKKPQQKSESATAGGPADLKIPNFTPLFDRKRLRLADVLLRDDSGAGLIGRTVTVCGWARTTRDAEAGKLIFVALSDGSCMQTFQAVVKHDVPGFEDLKKCGGVGASMKISGAIVESPAMGQAVEMVASRVVILGTVNAAEYPLAKKRHTLEHLRDIQHLRPRTNAIGAVVRVRNACAFAIHQFFNERGFYYIHTPLITCSDCEGAGEMFQVSTLIPGDEKADLPRLPTREIDYRKDFFSKPSFLTVSGQLQVECFACSMSDVYTFGPTFRAENSNTTRHLSEFWMIEPEIAFGDLNDDMDLAEDFLKYVTRYVLEHCAEDLSFFDQRFERGLRARLCAVVEQPFARMTYSEVVELLMKEEHVRACGGRIDGAQMKRGKFHVAPKWGIDLGSEHERYLTEKVLRKPVMVTDYPKDIKAFYMKLNEDGKTVRAMDVLVPKIGEVMGGSQREEGLDTLTARMDEIGVNKEGLKWYMDLRKYGTVPHAGFGLGFERLLMYVTGVENIRDVIPFPRYPGHADI